MKRTLFIKTRTITSLVVLLMTLPVWGNDGDTFTEDTVEGVMLTYTIISEEEKTCMVGEKYNWPVSYARANRVHKVSGNQPSGDITIPEVANGYAVIRIEAYAFQNAAITSVVIPNSVKAIGIGAFSGCVDLKSVRLSNQLTKIEVISFYNCSNLTSIDIPEGVTTIDDYAFYGCRQLKEAIIPSSAVHFGKYVFYSTGFTSMPKLPEGLTSIPYGIFASCPLTSVEIPQNITTIDGCAFNNCPFSEVEIPASVTHIAEAAFSRCKNLSSLVIPDNVTEIDFNAFRECTNLKAVTLSNNLSSLSEGIFSDCTSLESINIPSGVKTIGEMAFWQCSSLTTISIPETVESINNRAFMGCSSLTQLFIPKSVISIDTRTDWALLYACNSLTSIIVDKDNPVYDSRNNCNAIIETASNKIIAGCTTTKIPEGITVIGSYAFSGFENITNITLPQSLERIEKGAFHKLGLKVINIPENVTSIESYAFSNCMQLEKVKTYIKEPLEIPENAFHIYQSSINATLYVPKGTVDKYKATKGWNVFSTIKENLEPDIDIAYRPFIEDGKVWKVGALNSGNPVQRVEYFYFDGDTIIGGKPCKQMMRQWYVSPEHPDYDSYSKQPSLSYVGAWYEEDKKVYEYDTTSNQFKLMYDFSIDGNDTIEINNLPYVIRPRQTGGMKGFKGVYRDVRLWVDGECIYSVPWLEGVGGTDCPTTNVYPGYVDPAWFLMSCTVGDEVIYFNEDYEDGATPAEARKRFDFTHTIKTQPKAPRRGETDAEASAIPSLYGEYNNVQLGINLDPLDDAYMVYITDETVKVVYEKAINAGNIVGLNIDISAYAAGRYTVTVDNSRESFTGVFETQTSGIEENVKIEKTKIGSIYNLQGQRLSSLQKGLNIVNGQKIYVK
jgi:hypothetical protein